MLNRVLLVGFVMLVAQELHAQYVFTRIVDTSNSIPGGTGNFTGLQYPSISGSNASFYGTGANSQIGVYASLSGALTKIADNSTIVPGTTENFTHFVDAPPGISSSTVVFYGTSNSQNGVYTGIGGGSITRIVDKSTLIPNGSGNFVQFYRPVISSGTIAFAGVGNGTVPSGQDNSGIYTSANGLLTRIADTSTQVPSGTGTFSSFVNGSGRYLAISGNTVAFSNFEVGGRFGIYSSTGGVLSMIADTNTAIPNGTGNFTSFLQRISVSGTSILFHGLGSSGNGLYISSNGILKSLVDTNTPYPGGGNFSFFDNAHISGNYVVFSGNGSIGGSGIFVGNDQGVFTRLIGLGSSLDGRTILDFANSGDFSLSGSIMSFGVRFTDGSQGLYSVDIAAVPEPGTIALMLLVVAGSTGGYYFRRSRSRRLADQVIL